MKRLALSFILLLASQAALAGFFKSNHQERIDFIVESRFDKQFESNLIPLMRKALVAADPSLSSQLDMKAIKKTIKKAVGELRQKLRADLENAYTKEEIKELAAAHHNASYLKCVNAIMGFVQTNLSELIEAFTHNRLSLGEEDATFSLSEVEKEFLSCRTQSSEQQTDEQKEQLARYLQHKLIIHMRQTISQEELKEALVIMRKPLVAAFNHKIDSIAQGSSTP